MLENLEILIKQFKPFIELLKENRSAIIDRWIDHLSRTVSARYRELDRQLVLDRYELPFDHCLNAMGIGITRGVIKGSCFYFKDINDFIRRRVDEYSDLGLTIEEAKGSLLSFATVIKEYLEQTCPDAPHLEEFGDFLDLFADQLSGALNSTFSADVLEVMQQHRDEILSRWVDELPTDVVSPHFRLLPRDEATAPALTETEFHTLTEFATATLATCETMLTGSRQGVEAYVDKAAETFENRGFELEELQPAVLHLLRIVEPILYRRLVAPEEASPEVLRDRVTRLRIAYSQLTEIVTSLATQVSDTFGKGRTTKIHAEFEDMFHKIKNKIAELIGPLETLLTLDQDGNPYAPPMLLIKAQAQIVIGLKERNDALRAAVTAGDMAAAKQAAQAVDEFIAERQEDFDAFVMNLDSIDIVDEFMDMTYSGARNTTDLIRQLHEKQKGLLEKKAKEWETLPFRRLVEQAFTTHTNFAKQKKMDYALEVALNDQKILVIEDEVERVLDQTIHNALKYTPEGGKVHVRAYVDANRAVMSVADNGIGIPKEVQADLFALFFRTEAAKEVDPAGSGTGLYEDRKTMLKHGGDIWFESEGTGHGSTFYVAAPLYAQNGGPAASEGSSEAALPEDCAAAEPLAASPAEPAVV